MIQIRERSAVMYYQADNCGIASQKRRDNMLTARKTRYTGEITSGSRKRMSKCLTLMAQANKPRYMNNPVSKQNQWHHLTFLTLTIPGKNVTARYAYDKFLSHFLDWLTRTKKVKSYLWKVELQKRGMPHYHIIFPDWIHYKEIRNRWNSLLREHGQLDEYALKHKHFNAPSTDIRKVKGVKNIVSYLMKELGKSVDALRVQVTAEVDQDIKDGKENAMFRNEEITKRMQSSQVVNGKIWDASVNLKSAGYFAIPFTPEHLAILDKMIDEKLVGIRDEEFWSLLLFDKNKGPSELLTLSEKHKLEDHLKNIIS